MFNRIYKNLNKCLQTVFAVLILVTLVLSPIIPGKNNIAQARTAVSYSLTNLTSLLVDAGINNFSLDSIVTDAEHGSVYLGLNLYTSGWNTYFIRYNIGSNTITDLTVSSGLSALPGEHTLDQMLIVDGKLYVHGYNTFAVYNPATGLITDILTSSGLDVFGAAAERMVADYLRHKIYIGGYYGQFSVLDTITGVATNLAASSGLTAFWGNAYGDIIGNIVRDPVTGKIYLGGYDGEFGVYDPATNVATNLAVSSGLSSFWTNGTMVGMAYSTSDNKIYLAGHTPASVPLFAAYTPGTPGTATNIINTSGLSSVLNYNISSMGYDSVGNRIYFGAYSQMIEYEIGVASSAVLINDRVYGLDAIVAPTAPVSMEVDERNNLMYFGTNVNNFAILGLGHESSNAINLTTNLATIWPATPNILSIINDPNYKDIYIGSATGGFARYDSVAGTMIDLTSSSGLSAFWGTDGIVSMVRDLTTNKIYLGSSTGKLAVYTQGSPGTATDLSTTSGLSAFWEGSINAMVFNQNNGNIYLGGTGTSFAVYTPGAPGTATDLAATSGLLDIFTGNDVNSMTIDSINNRIYIGGGVNNSSTNFAVYTPGAPGSTSNLETTSGLSGFWTPGPVRTMVYNRINGKIYLGGDYTNFAAYTPGTPGTATDLATVSGLISTWNTIALTTLTFDPIGNNLYIGGTSGHLAVYNPDAGSSAADINVVSGLSVYWGTSNVNAVVFDSLGAALYAGGNSGLFARLDMGEAPTIEIPTILNYQARVTNASGQPISSATNMRFAIFDAATSGACLWSGWGTGINGCGTPNAGAVSITPVSGVFSIALGDTTVASQMAMPSEIFNGHTRYLEVQMFNGSTWETLSPRKRIHSSAYSMNVNRINGLLGLSSGAVDGHAVLTDSSGKLLVGGGASFTGGEILLTANADSVWSTTSGNLTIETPSLLNLGNTNATGVSIGRNAFTTIFNGNTTLGLVSGDLITINSGLLTAVNNLAVGLSGNVDAINFDANTLSIDAQNNRIGIGTSTPSSQLQIGQSTYIPLNMGLAVYRPDQTAVFSADQATNENNGLAVSVFDDTANQGTAVIYSNGTIAMGAPNVNDGVYLRRSATRTMRLMGSFDGATAGNLIVTGESSSSGGASFTGGEIIMTANADSVWSTSSGALTITSAAATTWGTSAGNFSLYASASDAASVVIGSAAGTNTPDRIILDNKNTVGDPTGTEGAMYYNSNAGRFRCFEGVGWEDCSSALTLQNSYNNGGEIITSGATDIVFTLTSGNFTASGAGSVNLTPDGASSFTSAGALTLTAAAASVWSSSADSLTITGAASLALDSSTTSAVNLGNGGTEKIVTIGNATGATAVNISAGTGGVKRNSSVVDGTGVNSAFVFDAPSITSGTAMRITSTTSTSGSTINADFTNTTGTIFSGTYESAITQGAGALTGMSLDLRTNLTTPAAGRSLTGVNLQMPAITTTSGNAILTGYSLLGGDIANSDAGSIDWRGINIVAPNITQGASGTMSTQTLQVQNGTTTTGGTRNNIDIDAHGVDAGTLNGIYIGSITAGAGIENAISIGTGYNNSINFAGAGTIITGADSNFSILTGTTGAVTLDSGTTGSVYVGTTASSQPAGTGAKALSIGNTTTGSTLVLRTPAGGMRLNGMGAVQASGTTMLCYNGSNILYDGNSATTCVSSSRRYKHDIADLALGLDAVRKLRPVSYIYNDTNLPWLGFIAEDVAEIDTRPVTYLDGEINGIDWAQIMPITAQGLKELDAVVSTMRKSFDVMPGGVSNIANNSLRFGEHGFAVTSINNEIYDKHLSFVGPSGNEIIQLTASGDLMVSDRLYLGRANQIQNETYLTINNNGQILSNTGYAALGTGYAETFISDSPIAVGTEVAIDDNGTNKVRVAKEGDTVIGTVVSEAAFVSGKIANNTVLVSIKNSKNILANKLNTNALVSTSKQAINKVDGGYDANQNVLSNIVQLNIPGSLWKIDEKGVLSSVVVKNDNITNAPDLVMYASTSDKTKIQISGGGMLSNGHSRIDFSEEVKSLVNNTDNYTVYLTMTSNGGRLYVSAKDGNGFEVTDSKNNTIEETFDWVVVINLNDFVATAR